VEANWEVAYEACFYRDLWHHSGKKRKPFSPKRTFDLCLLSDVAIIVIEAKSHEEFEEKQLKYFEKDKMQLVELTGVNTVLLSGLASSGYDVPPDVLKYFNGPMLTWRELAELYGNDAILDRADEVYEPDSNRNYGRHNSGGYMTGIELVEEYKQGRNPFVGRGGGLSGEPISQDIKTGSWRQHRYETNRDAKNALNANWFRLSDFIDRVNDA
jgi:hypothetical protein